MNKVIKVQVNDLPPKRIRFNGSGIPKDWRFISFTIDYATAMIVVNHLDSATSSRIVDRLFIQGEFVED